MNRSFLNKIIYEQQYFARNPVTLHSAAKSKQNLILKL